MFDANFKIAHGVEYATMSKNDMQNKLSMRDKNGFNHRLFKFIKIKKLLQERGFLSQVPKAKPMEHIGLKHFLHIHLDFVFTIVFQRPL